MPASFERAFHETGIPAFVLPLWVKIVCAATMAIGTAAGGWRIIRTLGRGLTDISTPQGFAAQTSSSAVILISSHKDGEVIARIRALVRKATPQHWVALALRFRDLAGGHFDRNLRAARLASGIARKRREVEPFVRLDQVDRHSAASPDIVSFGYPHFNRRTRSTALLH